MLMLMPSLFHREKGIAGLLRKPSFIALAHTSIVKVHRQNCVRPFASAIPGKRHIFSVLCASALIAAGYRSCRGPSGRMSNAWSAILTGTNKDSDALVSELEMRGRIQSPRVAEAMRKIDRKFFIRPDMPANQAYMDEALPIGYSQTISAPHMHAAALELLQDKLHPDAVALDVGSGSGYLSACMGMMMGEGGRVLGIERHPPLAQRSIASVRRAAPELLERGTVRLIAGNALDEALLDQHGPFDAIHVGAAADDLPQVLVDKLKPGGRMIIPVGEQNDLQVLKCIDKDADGKSWTSRDLMGVLFVPLKKTSLPAHDDPEA